MIQSFEEFNSQVNEIWGEWHGKRKWARNKDLENKEMFLRFMDRPNGLCLILCDDKSVNRNQLFENGLEGITDIYKVGEFTTEPAASAKDMDDEVLAEIKNGICTEDKFLIFVRFDIPYKWDTYVQPLMAEATDIIKLNWNSHKSYDRAKEQFKQDYIEDKRDE